MSHASETLSLGGPTAAADMGMLAAVSRWLELRLAACAPGLASQLVELGRLDPASPAAAQAALAEVAWRARWTHEPTRLRALCARLGLDEAHDGTLLVTLWALSEQHELEVLRRQAFNDDAFFPLQLVLRLCSDDPQQRARLMARLEPGAPLRALQLVHLVAPASRPLAALRHHLVELDEAVLARIEGRHSWPAQLDDCVAVCARVAWRLRAGSGVHASVAHHAAFMPGTRNQNMKARKRSRNRAPRPTQIAMVSQSQYCPHLVRTAPRKVAAAALRPTRQGRLR